MKIALPIVFILILAILQITLASKLTVFGVKPNFVLAGLFVLLIFTKNFLDIILAAVIGGLIYDWNDYFFGFNIAVLILTFLIFWFLGKKYIVSRHFLPLLIFSVFGTAVFNLIYISLSYLIFHYNFFDYFLIFRQLLEMGLNGLTALVFGGLFWAITKFKRA